MISIYIVYVEEGKDKGRVLVVLVYNLIPNTRDAEPSNLIILILLKVLYKLVVYYIRIVYRDYNLYYPAKGSENRELD